MSKAWKLIKAIAAFVVLAVIATFLIAVLTDLPDDIPPGIGLIIAIGSGVAGAMLVYSRTKSAISCGVAVVALFSYAMLTKPDATPERVAEYEARIAESAAERKAEEEREAAEQKAEEEREAMERKAEEAERVAERKPSDCFVDLGGIKPISRIRRFIQAHLKDPESYESISSGVNTDNPLGWVIVNQYRAKNSYGGFVVSEARVLVSDECEPLAIIPTAE